MSLINITVDACTDPTCCCSDLSCQQQMSSDTATQCDGTVDDCTATCGQDCQQIQSSEACNCCDCINCSSSCGSQNTQDTQYYAHDPGQCPDGSTPIDNALVTENGCSCWACTCTCTDPTYDSCIPVDDCPVGQQPITKLMPDGSTCYGCGDCGSCPDGYSRDMPHCANPQDLQTAPDDQGCPCFKCQGCDGSANFTCGDSCFKFGTATITGTIDYLDVITINCDGSHSVDDTPCCGNEYSAQDIQVSVTGCVIPNANTTYTVNSNVPDGGNVYMSINNCGAVTITLDDKIPLGPHFYDVTIHYIP